MFALLQRIAQCDGEIGMVNRSVRADSIPRQNIRTSVITMYLLKEIIHFRHMVHITITKWHIIMCKKTFITSKKISSPPISLFEMK